ncbi:MAG: MFS transporter [Planctomycetaceae bacterium]
MNDRRSESPASFSPPSSGDSIYGPRFWIAFAANLLLVAANVLTFRFAEFVNFLGESEETTGRIVQLGVIGSILIRFSLSRDLDRLGAARLWKGSSLLFIAGCSLLVMSKSAGWNLYVARMAFTIGLASMFACSNVHVQTNVPHHRRTEIIGSLGSSGFLGMIVGAQLGDVYFELLPRGELLFQALFGTAGVLGMLYLVMVWFITRGDRPPQPHEHSLRTMHLLRKHWPGVIVLVAMAMGIGFVVTTVFLTRYATSLNLGGVRPFFTAYAVSAFGFRVVSRRWSQQIGRRRMILIGLMGHVLGHLLLLPLSDTGYREWMQQLSLSVEWGFVPSGLLCGFGHALLFPCVVSLGSEVFPPELRGTGTTMILGFIDVGMALLSQPLGWIIDRFGFVTMMLTSASLMCGVAITYALGTLGQTDTDLHPRVATEPSEGESG